MLVFVVLPLLLIVLYAFQDSAGHFTLSNITHFFSDSDSLSTFAVSIEVAIENTLICILLGYPAAWILANRKYNRSAVTVVLFLMPMWINALMRTLATAELFNMLGIALGKGTLLFGMVYDFLPFMIYTVPLSLPGVMSGVLMVFMPTVSTFAISEFLTNNKIKLFGTIIQENINSSMWNYGAALAFIMLVIIGITTLSQGSEHGEVEGGLI